MKTTIFGKEITNLTKTAVDLNVVVSLLKQKLKKPMMKHVDSIYVGDFKELKSRGANSVYADGSIYVQQRENLTPQQIFKDIVHEIAHSIIESDNGVLTLVEEEFLAKRRFLYERLVLNDVLVNSVEHRSLFDAVEFNQKMDNLLYKKLGYDMLSEFTNDLFFDPYSITSIEEYFSSGFELWFAESDYKSTREFFPNLVGLFMNIQDSI